MTRQSVKMMESAKKNVPEMPVESGGITPNVNASIPAGQPSDKQTHYLKCRKCNSSLQFGSKHCASCGEPMTKRLAQCSCGVSLEEG
jgi:ribosomal protein L37E